MYSGSRFYKCSPGPDFIENCVLVSPDFIGVVRILTISIKVRVSVRMYLLSGSGFYNSFSLGPGPDFIKQVRVRVRIFIQFKTGSGIYQACPGPCPDSTNTPCLPLWSSYLCKGEWVASAWLLVVSSSPCVWQSLRLSLALLAMRNYAMFSFFYASSKVSFRPNNYLTHLCLAFHKWDYSNGVVDLDQSRVLIWSGSLLFACKHLYQIYIKKQHENSTHYVPKMTNGLVPFGMVDVSTRLIWIKQELWSGFLYRKQTTTILPSSIIIKQQPVVRMGNSAKSFDHSNVYIFIPSKSNISDGYDNSSFIIAIQQEQDSIGDFPLCFNNKQLFQ